MIDHVMLTNWRRFPRARVNCNVVYGDRFQSWRSHTKDISQSGCRVIGYYPFPLGKTLSLKLTHLQVPEPVGIIGKVVRLYGGAENALGLAFEDDARTRAKFQEWMRRVVSMDPAAPGHCQAARPLTLGGGALGAGEAGHGPSWHVAQPVPD